MKKHRSDDEAWWRECPATVAGIGALVSIDGIIASYSSILEQNSDEEKTAFQLLVFQLSPKNQSQ